MSQTLLDQTGQEDTRITLAKLNAMLLDIYGLLGGAVKSTSKAASATSGAATLNSRVGAVTSESLTTAAGGVYTLTITDSSVAAGDFCLAGVALGTATTGTPVVTTTTASAGQLVIKIQNIHATAALNGTIIVSFIDLKP